MSKKENKESTMSPEMAILILIDAAKGYRLAISNKFSRGAVITQHQAKYLIDKDDEVYRAILIAESMFPEK